MRWRNGRSGQRRVSRSEPSSWNAFKIQRLIGRRIKRSPRPAKLTNAEFVGFEITATIAQVGTVSLSSSKRLPLRSAQQCFGLRQAGDPQERAFCPAILDHHVLAFDVADFVEAFAECAHIARV